VVPSPTVFRMETDLLVGKEGHPRHSITNISVAQVNTHEADAPIAIERAEEINDLATTSTSTDSSTQTTSTNSTTSTTSTTFMPSTSMSSTETTEGSTELLPTTVSESIATEETSTTTTPSVQTTSVRMTTEMDEVNTTEGAKVVDVEADLEHPKAEERRSTSTVSVDLEEDQNTDLTANDDSEEIAESESSTRTGKQLSRELEESVRHLEKALDDADLRRKISTEDSALELSIVNQTFSEEDAILRAASELKTRVRSDEAGDHIRSVFGADRLFVEFGRVVEEKELPNGSWGGPMFADNRRTRMVAAIEKLIRSGAFIDEPFVFHVKRIGECCR
ncbi:hypothetical protein OSTOST_20724, partial [Ostertagia ostertagi]